MQTRSYTDGDPFFALRRLDSRSSQQFRREVDILQRYSGANRGHRHIKPLLLTYEHKGVYYALSQWADGNLGQFMAARPEPVVTPEMFIWLIDQCKGVAAAVRTLHKTPSWPNNLREGILQVPGQDEVEYSPSGFIKPSNVLWFKSDKGDPGTLVLSDPGMSKARHEEEHKARPSYSDFSAYHAPECTIDKAPDRYSDVWSLGCLYLELIGWYLTGCASLRANMPNDRLFDFVSPSVDDRRVGGGLSVQLRSSDRNVSVPGRVALAKT